MSNIAGMANITKKQRLYSKSNRVSGQTKRPTQNAIITNIFSILDLFIYINHYTSFISLCDTCKLLSELKKYVNYKLNSQYTKLYYRCNTFRDLVNSKVVSTHQLHFADCKSYYLNIISNIYTLDLYDNITDDIKSKPYDNITDDIKSKPYDNITDDIKSKPYVKKLKPYVKKLKPYYTKKAKHFSQKRVFYH
jgi:hypothetical protein